MGSSVAGVGTTGHQGVLWFVAGALQQLVNGFTAAAPLPVMRGDLFVPQGSAAAGAAAVDDLLAALRLRRANAAGPGVTSADEDQALRARRRLLGSATVSAAAGEVQRLEFRADAPGADWGVKGKESTAVSVFVDGRYHSDVIVLRERAGSSYVVNLGALAPGKHVVELRAARDLGAAGVSDAVVGAMRVQPERGDRALIARHQPIIQQRDLGLPGGRLEATHTDTPMLVAASVHRQADGTRRIDYYVMFSNEDGGTSMPKLVRGTGRGLDYEPLCSIVVDAQGKRIGTPLFQGPVHQRYGFDGQYAGERPMLRVATANNNYSTRLQRSVSLWSEAVAEADLRSLVPHAPDSSFTPLNNDVTWLTDGILLRRHPWMYAVMGKELLREGRSVAQAATGAALADIRQLLFLAPAAASAARRELEAGRPIQLRLRDGSTVDVTLRPTKDAGTRSAAIPLPAGVRAQDVAGLVAPGGGVWVLDEDFTPRMLSA